MMGQAFICLDYISKSQGWIRLSWRIFDRAGSLVFVRYPGHSSPVYEIDVYLVSICRPNRLPETAPFVFVVELLRFELIELA